MHFLLLLLRLVLDCLVPARRDGLTLAARADGRVEHVPTGPALWSRWLSLSGRKNRRSDGPGRKQRRGQAVRARQRSGKQTTADSPRTD